MSEEGELQPKVRAQVAAKATPKNRVFISTGAVAPQHAKPRKDRGRGWSEGAGHAPNFPASIKASIAAKSSGVSTDGVR